MNAYLKDGLTVAALKELLKEWPEEHFDGTPTVVVLSFLGDQSVVNTACPYNPVAGRSDICLGVTNGRNSR